MSTTSIKHDGLFIAHPDRQAVSGVSGEGDFLPGQRPFARWRRQALEALVFIAVMAIGQRRFTGEVGVPGLPHPYWLPVLLASCQYGIAGGMIAAAAASGVYVFELSPPSAAQDFYAYARSVALQPAIWLTTALVLGGLRSLHLHQHAEVSEQLAGSRRRGADLSEGLEQAVSEINALERRIAEDSSSVAALSRSLAQLDMSDRRSASASFGELFRVGTGVGAFVVYLRGGGGYAPACAFEKGVPRPTNAMQPLPEAVMESMISESARRGIEDDERDRLDPKRHVVVVPPHGVGAGRLAAIVCELQDSQEPRHFRRRAEDLSRMFATILSACPDVSSEVRR